MEITLELRDEEDLHYLLAVINSSQDRGVRELEAIENNLDLDDKFELKRWVREGLDEFARLQDIKQQIKNELKR